MKPQQNPEIRLTIPVSAEVHAAFSRIAEATKMPVGRAMGEWLGDTLDAAQFMAETLEKARRAPKLVAQELHAYALGLGDESADLLKRLRGASASEAMADVAKSQPSLLSVMEDALKSSTQTASEAFAGIQNSKPSAAQALVELAKHQPSASKALADLSKATFSANQQLNEATKNHAQRFIELIEAARVAGDDGKRSAAATVARAAAAPLSNTGVNPSGRKSPKGGNHAA